MIISVMIYLLHIIINFHIEFYSLAICFFSRLLNVLEHVQLEKFLKLSIKIIN